MLYSTTLPVDQAAIAFVDPKLGKVSYRALAERVAAWQQRLDALAAELGGRLLVGVEISARAPVIAAYFAALNGGHGVILAEQGGLTADSRIATRYRPNIVLRMEGDDCIVDRRCDALAGLHPELSLMLSTSGTTGDPKLVRLSAEAVNANAASIVEYLGVDASDVGITSLPLQYSYGMSVLHAHIKAGATLVLTSASVTDPGFAEDFAAHGVTNLACVPHQIDLMAAKGFDLRTSPGFRLMTQAGGRLAPEKVRKMVARGQAEGWDFVVMYGQTEAAPRMAYLPADAAAANADTIGHAIPGGRFRIVDEDGQAVPQGETGELVYEGPNVMLGYAETREDLARGRDVQALVTGDIAQQTEAGFIRLMGRKKRFVKLFGLRLSLDQIEARLQSAGLSGYAVSVDDRLVVMTLDAGQEAAIRSTVAEAFALPETDITAAHMAELPVQANGKPDLRQIGALARHALTDNDTSALPKGSSLQDIYAAALRRQSVTPEDSFVSLGGDSLAFLHVQLGLEERLGHVPDGWETMPISALEATAPQARKAWQPLDGNVILRISAISFVVLWHVNIWPLIGGTWALILLFGYSVARFQRQALGEGAVGRVAWNLLVPFLSVYFLLVAGYDLLRGGVPLDLYLLTANYGGHIEAPLLEPYWFVSLYAQLVLCLVLLGVNGSVREMINTAPFQFGILAFFLAIMVSITAQSLSVSGDNGQITLRFPTSGRFAINCLPFVFLGWSLAFATTHGRRLAVLAALIAILFIFPIRGTSYLVLICGGTLMLMFQAAVWLPSPVVRLAQRAAAATMFVYLLHNVVIHVVKQATPVHEMLGAPLGGALTLALSFALAMAADWALRSVLRLRLVGWLLSVLYSAMGRAPMQR